MIMLIKHGVASACLSRIVHCMSNSHILEYLQCSSLCNTQTNVIKSQNGLQCQEKECCSIRKMLQPTSLLLQWLLCLTVVFKLVYPPPYSHDLTIDLRKWVYNLTVIATTDLCPGVLFLMKYHPFQAVLTRFFF